MTAAEALSDRHLIASIAAKARIDARTVKRALEGKKGKGLIYEVALGVIRAAGIDLPGAEAARPALTSVPGGRT